MARYVPPNPDVTAQVDASQGPGPRSMRRMRVLVTGARGKVERATVPALQAAGHDVTATDLHEPEWDWQPAGTAWYVKAELTDAGQAYALINGAARGVGPRRVRCRRARSGDTRGGPARTAHHLRQQPDGHVQRGGSLRTHWREPPGLHLQRDGARLHLRRAPVPARLPAGGRGAPGAAQDPYALAKLFGEQLCDAAVRGSDLRCISLRPSARSSAGASSATGTGSPKMPMLRPCSAVSATNR